MDKRHNLVRCNMKVYLTILLALLVLAAAAYAEEQFDAVEAEPSIRAKRWGYGYGGWGGGWGRGWGGGWGWRRPWGWGGWGGYGYGWGR
ncbi:hypothetical protein QR680_011605 [Steinernema hermaphroditum]|uniref:Uncharacterized protein n=1 Tax=Steinernema hermaphroditum TaxID=289476 RepID=A0AA39LYC8_9BILA|nr:hypothetical protein QR680_011605 [Steinernema hermaphroditum]